MSNYKESLNKRIEQIKHEIEEQQSLRDSIKFNTTEWWEEHRNLESLRLDLVTVKSRKQNVDKPIEGVVTHKIIGDNNLNKY